jgi:DNA-binding NarL/FixJ family response regulator
MSVVNADGYAAPHGRGPVVRVLLVEGHYLVRAGIRSSLASHRSLRVVGEAARPEEALAVAAESRPDLVIIALDSVDRAAIGVIRALKRDRPSLRVVALAEQNDGDAVLAALRAGADGCVSKDASRRDLLDVLGRVAAGTAAIEPALGALLLRRLAEQADVVGVPAPEPLTEREREVLQMMARGKTNREIAGRLVLAVGTVKVHVEHILAKLSVPDRTAAAVRGVELGLVDVRQTGDEESQRVEVG